MNHAYANNVYKNNQIMTAPKKKLLIMLYDGAIKNCKLAEMALESRNFEEVNTNLKKAQDIINEFMVTLNFETGGDIAKNLYQLYEYMNFKLVRANIDKNPEGIIEVKNYLQELRDTWAQI